MGENNKTCILFGAGAETMFDLCNGAEFAKKVIGRNTEEMDKVIIKYYKDRYEKITEIKKDWYSKPSNQHITEILLLTASAKKKYLEEFFNLGKENKNAKNFPQEISKYLESCLKESNSDTGNKNEVNENGWRLIDKYTSYMGALDEKFHTLILPNVLGPNKFWKVVCCYTRAYLTLARAMYGDNKTISDEECYRDILENPKEFLKKANEFCESKKEIDSYYKVLREFKEKDSFRIITTNYTPLCSKITGICDSKIAYVHGRMGWFESAYELQVYDLIEGEELPNGDICFPYIFIQSGVKPIVERKQIEEYHKMIEFLKESKRLIIVGYRANSDDNHLNGIIKSFLNDKREVVYLDYRKDCNSNSSESEDDARRSVLSRFRANEESCNFKLKKISGEKAYKDFEEIISS